MNLLRVYKILLLSLSTACGLSYSLANQIDIDTTLMIPLNNKILGVNMAFFYSQVDAEAIDSTDIRYTGEKYSTVLADEIAGFNPGILRFPGGTVGNYYHYDRMGGYGSDTLDLLCKYQTKPGTYPSWYVNDRRYTTNFIEPYTELNHILKSKNKAASTLYVVNITSPIYKGAFFPLNASVKTHLQNLLGVNYGFFEVPVSASDTIALKTMADYVYTIYNEPGLKSILKAIFANDSLVKRTIRENVDAIKYLLANNISIAGIELGNELFNDYLLFDDDISSNTFDCNDLDSLPPAEIPVPTKLVDLPAIEVVTGMIKLWVMSELVRDSINTFLTTTYGFPFDIPYSYMAANNSGGVDYFHPKGALYKLAYLWNSFWAKHTWIDAAIVHTYMQGFMACDSLQTHPLEFLTDIGTRYTRHFSGQFLDNDIAEVQRFTGNKKMWLTEWNMNQAPLLGGTFTHSTFAAEYFMNMLSRIKKNPGRYEYWVYHNMCNGNSSNYSLFTTRKSSALAPSTVRWQMPYYSHYLLSGLIQKGFRYTDLSFLENLNDTTYKKDFQHSVFYHPKDQVLATWYINYSNDTLYLDWRRDSFTLQNTTAYYIAVNEGHTILSAASMFSTNDPCPGLPAITDTSFTFGEVSISDGLVALAPLSIGIIQMRLDIISGTEENKHVSKLMIYPNPGSGTCVISIPKETQASIVKWEIFNAMGQKVPGSTVLQIDPQNYRVILPGKGYFHIAATLTNGVTISGKVLVQ